jgi:hypothetical protein
MCHHRCRHRLCLCLSHFLSHSLSHSLARCQPHSRRLRRLAPLAPHHAPRVGQRQGHHQSPSLGVVLAKLEPMGGQQRHSHRSLEASRVVPALAERAVARVLGLAPAGGAAPAPAGALGVAAPASRVRAEPPGVVPREPA